MGELPKQLLAWMRRMLPKQELRGDGGTQIGKVGGDVTVLHFTQHVHPSGRDQPPDSGFEGGLHSHPPPESIVTVSAVLHLLDQLDAFNKRYVVLNFVQARFGTKMLKGLTQPELRRAHAYARGVLSKSQDLAQAAADGRAVDEMRQRQGLAKRGANPRSGIQRAGD